MERYERYQIKIKKMPPLFKIPHKYEPIVNKFELFKMITSEFFHNLKEGLKKRKLKDYIKLTFSRPCKYGVFSGRFGGFKPIREKCVRCFECKIEYPRVIKDVIINPHYKVLEKFNLSIEDIDTILFESETGMEKVSGMGYKGPFVGKGFDSIWLDMSEIVRPTRDGKEGREYISTETQIGRKVKKFGEGISKTLTVQIPVIFEYEPLKDDNFHRILSCAAYEAGTFYILGISNFKKLERDYKNIFPLFKREEKIEVVSSKIVEFEVEENDDIKILEEFKKNNDKSIMIARIKAKGDFKELIYFVLNEGADGIHLVFKRDGYAFDNKKHLTEILRDLNEDLIEKGIRSQITLIVSGGINKAEHVPKAIGCGADLVAIDVPLHIALQSEFKERDDEYEIVLKKLNFDWGKQRILNLLSAWHEQLIEALSAMGKRDVRRLVGDYGRLIFFEEIFEESFAGIEMVK